VAERPMTPRQALLTALAGVTAYRADMKDEVLSMGAEDPGMAFAGAVSLACWLSDEVRALGGDPEALMRRVYCAASKMAPS
jgi:hypothetical protein